MKRLLIPCIMIALSSSYGSEYGDGIPREYDPLLDEALELAGDHAGALKSVLTEAPKQQRPGVAFLISYMPAKDLTSLDPAILRDNVRYAYRARGEFPWAASIPDSLFLNDVLPYAVVDETREPWRKQFYELFKKRVKDCSNLNEAITAVNKGINEAVGVEYDTRREKTNQSPSESMRQHMASCTGLSILLIDAFRSVGIPARFAGTASWHDNRGNHSWVEVWDGSSWAVTEFYMPRHLNKPWFLANAGKANPSDKRYAIYASSYCPTGDSFPMVWNRKSTAVHGINVTRQYIDIYRSSYGKALCDGSHVNVSVRMFKDKDHHSRSADRVATNVDVFDNSMQVDGGRTAGPHQDMNDVLTFVLEKGRTYTLKYLNGSGEAIEVPVKVGNEPVTIDSYME